MEQHLICEICNLRYNLSTREPLLVSCCDETVCRACWRKAFDQGGLFVCPHKCGLKNEENPQESRVNKTLLKIVAKNVPLEITCDEHLSEDVVGYSESQKIFVCSKCPKHKGILSINREMTVNTYKMLKEKLNERRD